jgi:hypothetical protein
LGLSQIPDFMVELLLDPVFNFFSSLANALSEFPRMLGDLTSSSVDVLLHMFRYRLSAGKWIWLIGSIKSTRLDRPRLNNRPSHLCLTLRRRRLPRRVWLNGWWLSTSALTLLLGRAALCRFSQEFLNVPRHVIRLFSSPIDQAHQPSALLGSLCRLDCIHSAAGSH